jgi:hypothetical protein
LVLVVDATDCAYGSSDGIDLGKTAAVATAALELKPRKAICADAECVFRYNLRFAIRQAISPLA